MKQKFTAKTNPKGQNVEAAVAAPVRSLIALGANLPTVLARGFHDPLMDVGVLKILQLSIVVVYLITLVLEMRTRFGAGAKRTEFIRITRPEQFIGVATLVLAWWSPALAIGAAALLLVHVVRWYLRLVELDIPSGLVFVGSFVVLIGVGTAALLLPSATPPDKPISVLDAAFTITSAISQTGLVVRPTGEGFTRFGQVIILIWIQVGALGVIVFGALLANVIGSSFGLRATQTIAEGTEQGWAGQLSLQRLVTFIIIFTHLVEGIGAAFFYFGWPEEWPGMPIDMDTPGDRLFHSVFFSVSAFCNAGFATTSDSMESLRNHWIPHLLIVPLIIFGSIGFPVLNNLREVAWARIRGVYLRGGSLVRLTLNTKIVLATTALLYVFGFAMIFIGELTQTEESLWDVVLDAHFMNINRTTGFDTIPPSEMGLLGRLVLIFLMFVGGSPASVAGGAKVMVIAVLGLTVWANIRGRDTTTAFGRTLPDALVRKCATLIVLCLGVCMVTAGILAAVELKGEKGAASLDALLFEAVSAFGTTGLSMGITSELSPAGKGAIMFAMFVGRVGIFAVLAALLAIYRKPTVSVYYPTEDVVVY